MSKLIGEGGEVGGCGHGIENKKLEGQKWKKEISF